MRVLVAIRHGVESLKKKRRRKISFKPLKIPSFEDAEAPVPFGERDGGRGRAPGALAGVACEHLRDGVDEVGALDGLREV